MRKADYAMLAEILAIELHACTPSPYATDSQICALHSRQIVIERIARRFCARASVDKVAFLKACGLS